MEWEGWEGDSEAGQKRREEKRKGFVVRTQGRKEKHVQEGMVTVCLNFCAELAPRVGGALGGGFLSYWGEKAVRRRPSLSGDSEKPEP